MGACRLGLEINQQQLTLTFSDFGLERDRPWPYQKTFPPDGAMPPSLVCWSVPNSLLASSDS